MSEAEAISFTSWWTAPKTYHVMRLFLINQIFLLEEYISIFFVSDKTTFQKIIYSGYIFVDILSAGLIQWRFATLNRDSSSYVRLVRLLKREDRSRVASSFLLIMNSYWLVVMATVEFLDPDKAAFADNRHPLYAGTILAITLFFAVVKVKYAVNFCSRSLLLSSYFNSLGVIVLLAQILDAHAIEDYEFNPYVVSIVGFMSAYLGFKTLANATFTLFLPYWRISWWQTGPVLTNDPNETSLEIYERAMREQKLNVLFFGGTTSVSVRKLNIGSKFQMPSKSKTTN